ncbi:regulatory protein RecX [Treponema primitia]|uniref:regulatory protein RecX n=1 Tax=Treponema primitia TaxID=88058 RepID=UPI0002554D59|nr:regulatory protein RecX [Treponema primitia]
MVVASVKTTETKAGPVILRIGLSDGSLFSLNSVYLPHPFQGEDYFCPNKEITPEEETALRFAADCFRAERAALQLVARAEQTRAGITRKLEQRGHALSPVRAAVSYLTDLEIVDDRRFAERWIQSRLYRGTDSPFRLITALCQKGISQTIAKSACKTILDFEKETALLQKYIAKKYPPSVNSVRQDRFLKPQLKREGFSPQALDWYWETQ